MTQSIRTKFTYKWIKLQEKRGDSGNHYVTLAFFDYYPKTIIKNYSFNHLFVELTHSHIFLYSFINHFFYRDTFANPIAYYCRGDFHYRSVNPYWRFVAECVFDNRDAIGAKRLGTANYANLNNA